MQEKSCNLYNRKFDFLNDLMMKAFMASEKRIETLEFTLMLCFEQLGFKFHNAIIMLEGDAGTSKGVYAVKMGSAYKQGVFSKE